MRQLLLEVKDYSLSFRMYDTGLKQRLLHVIDHLSMDVKAGEVLAVVGSSGSGKSLMASSILGLLPRNAIPTGSIKYKGQPADKKFMSGLMGRQIVYVPQSVNNLDPTMRVGKQVIGLYGTKERQEEVFRRYGLGPEVEKMYPFQLSGGMARRVMLSMAVMNDVEFVVADEPTPGMSLEMARETLIHFREIADEGAGVLLITHDLNLALLAADRVAVFYAGTIIEIAPKDDFKGKGDSLRHPYTKALWRALPQNGFESIEGLQPYAGTVEKGCRFIDRCPYRGKECEEDMALRELRGGEVRCSRAV